MLLFSRLQAAVFVFISLAISVPASHATTFWTGPDTNWTKSVTTPSDTVLPGKVILTRGGRGVLINTSPVFRETSATTNSPKGTLWAFGTFASHTAFQTMDSIRLVSSGNLSAHILNQSMVMWITNDDIFVSVRFTTWGQFGAGTVAYTRSTPSPGVSITNPSVNAVFAEPATVALTANASLVGGTITNVSFFEHTTLLGSAQTAPFKFTTTALPVGVYAFSAIATGSGLSGTSSVVNMTVISPVDVSVTPPNKGNGLFSFSYSADPGLRYVVERSSDLNSPIIWKPVVTNVASGNFVPFSQTLTTDPARYYRVGRLPNP